MNRPKQLILLRHAQSARQAAKSTVYFADEYARRTVEGVPDYKIPLTSKGTAQAEQTGRYLKERFGTFDYIYHSGYKRTKDTLENVLLAYDKDEREAMKVRHDLFIRERDPGYGYDMTEAEAKKAFPWLAKYWESYGGFFAVPPGGESIAKMCERVFQFLGMLFNDHDNQTVLVVTHGGTIRAFRYLLEHWTYEQAIAWPKGSEPQNCAATIYTYDSDLKALTLREYNTMCHTITE